MREAAILQGFPRRYRFNVDHGKEAIAYYEVLLVTADKKTIEVEVAPDGKIIKTEDKKDD